MQTHKAFPRLAVLAAAVATLIAADARPTAAATCESLASLTLADATITMAQPVAAGAFTQPGGRGGGARFSDLPAFCRVAATLTPTKESQIQIEVWLPAAGWNGRFQAVGNGGWNGNIDTNALAAGLRRGYATAGTDTGHQGGGGPWMRNREQLIDYGHRAVHEMTVTAKAIVNAFYERAPRFSYFNGCSGGGRQALVAAQRYPDDFDGIVAGAPALNATGRAAFAMWIAQNVHRDEASFIPPALFPVINEAVLQACDTLDGLADGVIDNPQACRFDPQVLACKPGAPPASGTAAACLTPAQVETARTMYAPLVNPRTKEQIFPGLAYGTELGWTTFAGQQPFGIGAQMFQHMVFADPDWDYKTLNFDSHMALVSTREGGLVNALETDLTPFFASGGKLIHYHGWADPQIPAASSSEYYERVLQTMGGSGKVSSNYRLFMVPGMAHCGGGTGTSTFDMLGELEQWVEAGDAPDSIPASRMANGTVNRTRPLCPYPQRAVYRGSGSIDDAANFACK